MRSTGPARGLGKSDLRDMLEPSGKAVHEALTTPRGRTGRLLVVAHDAMCGSSWADVRFVVTVCQVSLSDSSHNTRANRNHFTAFG